VGKGIFSIILFSFISSIGFGQCELSIHTQDDNGCLMAVEEVVWSNLVNVGVSGNQVFKTGGGNWQSGCTSTGSVYSEGYAYTVISETNTRRAFGLSSSDGGADLNSIEYAVYLRNNGTINVYESGNNRGNVGSYSVGDTIFIKVENDRILYFKNQNILYTGGSSPNTPLIVDCSFRDDGAQIANVRIVNTTALSFIANHSNPGSSPNYQWQVNGQNVGDNQATYSTTNLEAGDIVSCQLIPGTDACSIAPQTSNEIEIRERVSLPSSEFYAISEPSPTGCKLSLEEVVWDPSSYIRTYFNGQTLSKIKGNGNWNAGSFSLNAVHDNGSFYTIVTETDKRRIIGLNDSGENANYTNINYAFYLRNNGSLNIFESGADRGNFGSYSTGDTLRISLEPGAVKYYRNSELLRIGAPSSSPLIVDVSMRDVGATFGPVYIENKNQGEFVAFTNNLGTPSFEWSVNDTPQGNNSPVLNYTQIDDGDEISCAVNPGLNGCSSTTYFSRSVSINLNNEPEELNFYISGEASGSACIRTTENVKWDVFSAEKVDGIENSAVKVQGNGNWNAGISSLNRVSDNGYLEFTVAETDKRRMIGLSSADDNVNFNSIDYAIYLRNNGTISIYESGNNRGSFGDYDGEDIFRISVEEGTVHYYQNDQLLRIASAAPDLPLIADLSFRDVGATANNLIISNYSTGTINADATNAGQNPIFNWFVNGNLEESNSTVFTNQLLNSGDMVYCELIPDLDGCNNTSYSSNPVTILHEDSPQALNFYISGDPATQACLIAGENVSWNTSQAQNVEIQGSSLIKIQNNGQWNAGSSSLNSIATNGYFKFSVQETNRRRVIGLSHEDLSTSLSDIDYGIYLRNNGSFQIYESGNNLGNFGNYNTGDEFEIKVFDSEVSYYLNGNILFISNKAPVLPLIADVSIRDVGGTVTNPRIVKDNSGSFTAHVSNAGENPVFQWNLNGQNVGTNSPNYTNPDLTESDEVICELIPDLGNCSQTTYHSNGIILQLPDAYTPFEFYIESPGILGGEIQLSEEIQWSLSSLNHVVATNNSLEKIQSNGQWNGNAFSFNSLNGTGYLEYVVDNPYSRFAVGLSSSDQNSSFTSIDFCFRHEANGTLRINENGTNRGNFGSVSPGDTLRIIAESGTIRYQLNQNLLYTSNSSVSFPLYADVSMRDVGSEINSASIVNYSNGSFYAQIPNGENADFQWYLNGVAAGINSSSYSNSTLDAGDIVTCQITPQFAGCSNSSYTSNSIRVLNPSDVNNWIGNVSTDWNNPSNWSMGVPNNETDVRINSGTAFQPVITNPATCRDITIDNGSTLTISNSALILSGDLYNNSSINASTGTITFFGQNSSTVNGTGFQVNRMVTNKSSVTDTIYLNTDISIIDEFVFINGVISTGSNEMIFLDESSSRDGSYKSYVDGKVRKIGNNDFTFPIGKAGYYAPISIEVFGTNSEEYTAEYFNENPNLAGYNTSNFENSLESVSSCEYWILNHELGTGLTRVGLSYGDDRSCGISEPWNLTVSRWNGSTWIDHGANDVQGDSESGLVISSDEISEFSPFALGRSGFGNPLPVELLDFNVSYRDYQVKIAWSSATEINCDYYVVERSKDLLEFSAIGSVNGSGNSTGTINYKMYDDSNISGTWYYRLKQVDFDGNFKVYPPRSVVINPDQSLLIYPNPAIDQLNIVQSGLGDNVEIKVYNLTGNIVKTLETLSAKSKLSIGDIPSGTYILEVSGAKGVERRQLIKK